MRSGFMNRMKQSVNKQDKVSYSHFPGLNIKESPKEQEDDSFFYKYFFFLTVKFYKPYFLMSTKDVSERIMCSVKPWNTDFFDKIHEKPDFYGPFWIYTTLIFALSASGNFYHYIKVLTSKNKHAKFQYNFKFIPQAFGYVYGYGLIVPTIIYFGFKIFKIEINFPKVFCIYGYAMFPFIIASFICIVPNWLLSWLVILAVLAGQIFFIVSNYWAKVKEIETQSRYIMIGIIAVVQFVAIIAFRIAFFKSVYK